MTRTTRFLLFSCLLSLSLQACSKDDSPSGNMSSPDASADRDSGLPPDDMKGHDLSEGVDLDASPEMLTDASPDQDQGTDMHMEPTDPDAWRLPEGYFTPSRMEMVISHPRPNTPDWAYSRNAYPGLAWETPIVVQGGAWPFKYELVSNGGAQGLKIGEVLDRQEVDGFTIHSRSEDYGILSWDDPQPGNYEVEVRVTDQELATTSITFNLQVGTQGWVFVDAEQGDDSTADGSIDKPFKTLEAMHRDDAESDHFARHRLYLAGVVPMDGNRPNGNLRIVPDGTPTVWVGWPGRQAVLEAYEGKFVLSAQDFYMANLEHRHREDYFPDDGSFLHMFTIYTGSGRFTMHDVDITRFQGKGVNTALGNSCVMMFTKGDNPHMNVVNNRISGPSGVFTSTYSLFESVFENNIWSDAIFDIADGSAHAVIYVKGGVNEKVTVRGNVMGGSNDWTTYLAGIGLLQARNIEVAHNIVDHNATGGRTGAFRLWTNSPQATFEWTEDTPVWIDRNSVRHRMAWEGNALANMPDGTVRIEGNVISPGNVPSSPRTTSNNNLVLEESLDEQMQLLEPFRSEHFGQRGAIIAVPSTL